MLQLNSVPFQSRTAVCLASDLNFHLCCQLPPTNQVHWCSDKHNFYDALCESVKDAGFVAEPTPVNSSDYGNRLLLLPGARVSCHACMIGAGVAVAMCDLVGAPAGGAQHGLVVLTSRGNL